MPKRTNPFGDSSPLQLKSHIRQKEVDMGVLQEENMKAVYGKFLVCMRCRCTCIAVFHAFFQLT